MTTTTRSSETHETVSPPAAGQRTVVMERIIDAPRDLVFKVWTDPQHLARWWGPHGFTNPVCEVDARPGGAIRIHMAGPDGTVYPLKGTFQEIVAPERLVMTNGAFADDETTPLFETRTTVTFSEHGRQTKLALEAVVTTYSPAADFALAGMEEGWKQSLERLATELQAAQGESAMSKTNPTQITAEPGQHAIVLTREFDAPRELVFRAFTDPELYTQWLGPRRLTMTIETFEPRNGGRWRYINTDSEGNAYGFHGVYHEVVAPERITNTFEFEGVPGHVALETARFDEQGGKTRLTMVSVFQSVADRDGMLQSGMEGGMSESMERLAELLERLHPASSK